jgi:hypothetical protein
MKFKVVLEPQEEKELTFEIIIIPESLIDNVKAHEPIELRCPKCGYEEINHNVTMSS